MLKWMKIEKDLSYIHGSLSSNIIRSGRIFKNKFLFIFTVLLILVGCISEETNSPETAIETVKLMLDDIGFKYSSIYYVKETKDGIVTFFQPKDKNKKIGYGFIADRSEDKKVKEQSLREIYGQWQWVNRGFTQWYDFGFNGEEKNLLMLITVQLLTKMFIKSL